MARHFSPQKKRNKTISSSHQRIISHYFTPRSGVNKEEVNFLVKASPGSRGEKPNRTTGVQGPTDQVTFNPAFGFTTAAKIHQQSGGCYSRTENQRILSGQRNLESRTCKCAVSRHVTCACSPLKNSSAEEKQTRLIDHTRVLGLMASSASSSSSSPTSNSFPSSCPPLRNTRRTRRSNSRAQNHFKGKSAKKQKRAPETITVDSEDENCLDDDDCCVIMNVVRGRKVKSDSEVSEVEESSSCSQSSTSMESSSQESKLESSYKSSSSSGSDQKHTASSCKKSSLSSKSVRHTKKQAPAKSTFGLVGGDVSDSDDDDDSQDSSQCDSDFAQLPVEILENIFCQLPIVDLMLNCALVCRQWYDIISRDSVI